MANHYRVSPKFWLKARERGWNDAQTTLALYLLTCEHRNLEGLYRLPKAYIADDLLWSPRKVDETLAVVCESGFAEYDDEAGIVLIPKALKHQSPSTPNHIKGAIGQLERLPRTSLWDAFLIACASHCPRLADAIAMRWPSNADGISRAHVSARGDISTSSSNSISSSTSSGGAGESKTGQAKTVADVIDILRQCQRLHVDQIGVENMVTAWPGRDYLHAARTVVSWATDPAFRNTNGAKLLGDALSKQTPAALKAAGAAPIDFSKYDRAAKRPEAA